MRIKQGIGYVTLLAISLSIAACGGSTTSSTNTTSGNTTSTSPMDKLKNQLSTTSVVAAAPNGQLAFVPKSINTKSGMNTFVFNNSSAVDHSMVIEKPGGGDLAGTPVFQGGTKKFQVNLQKGTYTFYCSVPGHRQAGMVGTITVS
jgi:uncharacterized cupredoxin-like copper-binding protein